MKIEKKSVSYRFDTDTWMLYLIDVNTPEPMNFSLATIEAYAVPHVAELICQAYEAGWSRSRATE